MALYRTVSTTFWDDGKIVDDFTAEERYLYLYLLTNQHTNLCGCYEISIKQMSFDTGLDQKKVEKLIDRLANVHRVIGYDGQLKEIVIINWSKYNWTASDKMRQAISKEITQIKSQAYMEFLMALFNGTPVEQIPYGYGMNTIPQNTISNTKPKPSSSKKSDEEIKLEQDAKSVLAYLNKRCGMRYRDTAEGTLKPIKARLREFTVKDCYTVIDKKADSWMKDEKMRKYLRPETLFGPKFESYLNEPTSARSGTQNNKYAVLEQLTQESIRSDHGAG